MHTLSTARRIRRAGVIGVILAVIAVLGAAGLLYQNQLDATAASASVSHTHYIIETLDALEVELGHAEIAVRDGLIVGPVASRHAFDVARVRADSELGRALDSTGDNPEQQRRLRELTVVMQERFAAVSTTMALPDTDRPALAAARLSGQESVHSAQAARELLGSARQAEYELLAARQTRLRDVTHRERVGSAWALAMGIVVVLVSFWAVRREAAALRRAWGTARDAALAARESESRYRLLFSNNPRPTWVYDRETLRFLAVNPAAVAHYGYDEREFLDMTLADLHVDEERAHVAEWSTALGDATTSSERWHLTKDGREIRVHIASHPLTFAGRAARLVVVEDVTDRRRHEAQLQDLAMRDSLTGLTNRRGFEEFVSHEIGVARRTHRTDALLYLDLDGFKVINDTHGHAEGDAALRAVAEVLRATVRDHDVVGRMGGDELVVYVTGLQRRGEGHAVATRLQAALDAHNRDAAIAGRPYRIAFSAGVAELAAGDTLDTLLARADAALYQAKQERRAAA